MDLHAAETGRMSFIDVGEDVGLIEVDPQNWRDHRGMLLGRIEERREILGSRGEAREGVVFGVHFDELGNEVRAFIPVDVDIDVGVLAEAAGGGQQYEDRGAHCYRLSRSEEHTSELQST